MGFNSGFKGLNTAQHVSGILMPIIRSSETAVAASGLPSELGDSRPARPRPTELLSPNSDCKPEADTAVFELLMMGMRLPETCWALFKRQVINLRSCCLWLVDSVESMMMHGLANPKFPDFAPVREDGYCESVRVFVS